MTRDEFGNWELELPKGINHYKSIKFYNVYITFYNVYLTFIGTIPHNTKVKTFVLDAEDKWVDRIPVYIKSAY